MEKASKRVKKSFPKKIKDNSVHLHYSCHCPIDPEININESEGNIEINIINRCPLCNVGEAKELIIGNMIKEIGKCEHPNCECGEISIILSIHNFINYIK